MSQITVSAPAFMSVLGPTILMMAPFAVGDGDADVVDRDERAAARLEGERRPLIQACR